MADAAWSEEMGKIVDFTPQMLQLAKEGSLEGIQYFHPLVKYDPRPLMVYAAQEKWPELTEYLESQWNFPAQTHLKAAEQRNILDQVILQTSPDQLAEICPKSSEFIARCQDPGLKKQYREVWKPILLRQLNTDLDQGILDSPVMGNAMLADIPEVFQALIERHPGYKWDHLLAPALELHAMEVFYYLVSLGGNYGKAFRLAVKTQNEEALLGLADRLNSDLGKRLKSTILMQVFERMPDYYVYLSEALDTKLTQKQALDHLNSVNIEHYRQLADEEGWAPIEEKAVPMFNLHPWIVHYLLKEGNPRIMDKIATVYPPNIKLTQLFIESDPQIPQYDRAYALRATRSLPIRHYLQQTYPSLLSSS